MKKLILSAAVLLGTINTFAAEDKEFFSSNNIEIVQDEFTEIEMDAVPDTVKATIANSFTDAKIEKAYSNENKEYKLEVSMGEKTYTIYTDAEGQIIQK